MKHDTKRSDKPLNAKLNGKSIFDSSVYAYIFGKYFYICIALVIFIIALIPWESLYENEFYRSYVEIAASIFPVLDNVWESNVLFKTYARSMLASVNFAGLILCSFIFAHLLIRVQITRESSWLDFPIRTHVLYNLFVLPIIYLMFWWVFNWDLTMPKRYPTYHLENRYFFVVFAVLLWWVLSIMTLCSVIFIKHLFKRLSTSN